MPLVGKYGHQRVPYDMQHTIASLGSDAALTNDQMASLTGHRKTSTFELAANTTSARCASTAGRPGCCCREGPKEPADNMVGSHGIEPWTFRV